MEIDHWYS